MNSFINVRGVCKTYDGKQYTPKAVSFEVAKHNPIVLLQGDNGSGKTTLINIIIDAESLSGGEVVVSDKSNLSILFQNNGLLPHLTVVENLKIVEPSLQHITDMVIKLGLTEGHLYSFANKLSGGEERRVQLARLYLSSRDIWILDEPTSHADRKFRSLLVNGIAEHIAIGGICILVTHDDEFISAISSKLPVKLNVVEIQKSVEATL
jgi:ATPase subunit of ABC transporter with duplicated ATPase domains